MSDSYHNPDIQILFDNNEHWARQMELDEPGFFARLAGQQKPKYLWIGCSDSRVPANQITGLPPGEVFVHRNVANVVLQTDLNCMSVVDFAIQSLQVRHVIVCGHYGCAGIKAAMEEETVGVVDHWLSGIRELRKRNAAQLGTLTANAAQSKLCELNVLEQMKSLCRTTVISQAWRRGQSVDVHGWIYGINDGLLRKIATPITSMADLGRIESYGAG